MQQKKTKNIILLIIRIVLGGMFVFAGVMKLIDPASMVEEFSVLGLSSTIFWLVAVGEVLAGLGVLLGIYTELAAVGAGIIMAGATYLSPGAGALIPGALFVLGVVHIFTGGGKYSLGKRGLQKKGETGN